MKKYFEQFRGAALAVAVALLALLPSEGALAQVVTQQPQFAAPRAVLDLGNGPTEIKALSGSGAVFTASGSGLGSGTTTSITLTATPTANPPCVGCQITGAGITGTTLITAYNGTTGITVNTSQTISASTPLAWGAACPAVSAASGVPPQGYPSYLIGTSTGVGDLPLYTAARICIAGLTGPGLQFVNFAIGAH